MNIDTSNGANITNTAAIKLSAGILNARSAKNKTAALPYIMILMCFLKFSDSDLAETRRHGPGHHDLCPTGYSFLHVPRHTGDDGVGIMCKDSLKVKQLQSDNKPTSFECMKATLSSTDNTPQDCCCLTSSTKAANNRIVSSQVW